MIAPNGQEKNYRHLQVVEPGQKPKGDYLCKLLGEDIEFDAAALHALAEEGCTAVHYDLLVLCAAIELTDRHWRRNQTWSRNLHLTVPVIELSIWNSVRVKTALEGVLRYLTCDNWQFTFVQAKNRNPCEWQLKLSSPDVKTFVIAYSEGLDSRAVSALSGNGSEALCIRVTNNHNKTQEGDSFFTQIPFTVNNKNGKEGSFRTRGFQFAAITAIAANIRGVKRIVVPESGQGAISSAIRPLHRLYSDYRNYPTFFRKLEHFFEQLLAYKVEFDQPRLWSTKGETLKAFLQLPGKTPEHLINTRSCWQTRHIVNVAGTQKQCGLCAACLLRRMSMHAAGIKEPEHTYVIHDLSATEEFTAMSQLSNVNNDRVNMVDYGCVATRHFQHFANMAELPLDQLFVYALEIAEATGCSVEDTLKNLKMLLSSHAEEWESFIAAQGQHSFLRKWKENCKWSI